MKHKMTVTEEEIINLIADKLVKQNIPVTTKDIVIEVVKDAVPYIEAVIEYETEI